MSDLRKSISFIFVIIISLTLLIIVSFPYKKADRWSDWAFGDAQSIFCAEHWARDGFLYHRFLPLFTPYSVITKHLDEHELRQYAHGTRTGHYRCWRYYTHYPIGSMGVVASILMKLGLWDKFYYQLTHFIISLLGLFFFYLTASVILGPVVALVPFLFYLFSPAFSHYAASLSNASFDIFFPWLIIFLYAFMLKGKEEIRLRFLKIKLPHIISLLFFVYSFFSIDYALFSLLSMLAINIYYNRKVRVGNFMAFISCYGAGLLVHLIQNATYMGWRMAVKDFMLSSSARGADNIFHNIKYILSYRVSLEPLIGIDSRVYLISAGIILIGLFLYPLLSINKKFTLLKIAVVLHLAGSALFLIYSGLDFPFFAKLYVPEILMFYMAVIFLVMHLKNNIKFIGKNAKTVSLLIISVLCIAIPSLYLWKNTLGSYYENFRFEFQEFKSCIYNEPAYEDLLKLGSFVRTIGESDKRIVFFNSRDAERLDIMYDKSILQIGPVVEYYFRSPIFIFDDNREAAKDMLYCFEKENSIRAVLMARHKGDVKDFLISVNRYNSGKKIAIRILRKLLRYNDFFVLSMQPEFLKGGGDEGKGPYSQAWLSRNYR